METQHKDWTLADYAHHQLGVHYNGQVDLAAARLTETTIECTCGMWTGIPETWEFLPEIILTSS